MKRLVKENKLLIISFLIVIGVLLYNIIEYNDWFKANKELIETRIQECKSEPITEEQEICNELLNSYHEPNPDFYYTVTVLSSDMDILIYLMFTLISIPVLYYVCNLFKSRNILYLLTRENYKQMKKNILLKAYKSSLILPIIYLIIIVFSLIYCRGFNIDSYYALMPTKELFNEIINPYIYVIALIFKALLTGLIYVNIALIVARKNHNFYLSSLLSYILFIAIEIFLEALVGYIIFGKLLHIDSMMIYFNIMNIFSMNLSKGYIAVFIPLIVLFSISTIILSLVYKNKEKLVIDCDKNN